MRGDKAPKPQNQMKEAAVRTTIMRIAHWWSQERLLIGALTILGLVLRVIASRELPLYVDEGFTLLGTLSVIAHGIPLFPSGVLYLHGATLSYLLAPAAAIGWADLDHINMLRAIPVALGTAVIPLTAILARQVVATRWVGVAAAALMAIDPLSIHWSAYVRMYPLLQLVTVSVALCVVILLRAAPSSIESRRSARWLVALTWLGVFTHLSAALLVPVFAALFMARWGLALPRSNPAIARALAWCALAPVVQVGISSVAGSSSTMETTDRRQWLFISFLGDHRLNFTKFLAPDFVQWLNTFPGEPFGQMPALFLVAASTIVAIRAVLGPREDTWPRAALLALYWLPVLAFVLLTNAQSARYFAFVQPLAAALLAVAAQDMLLAAHMRGTRAHVSAVSAVTLAAAMLIVRDAQAITTVGNWEPLGIGDQRAAIKWVGELRRPGDLVINQTAVFVYLEFGDIPEARYLNRYDEPNEYVRYVRFTPEGEPVDYWLGKPVIGTMSDLCRALVDRPGSFLIMAEIAFAPQHRSGWYGEMIDMIEAATEEGFAANGVVVKRSTKLRQWEEPAIKTCSSYGVDIREERHWKHRSDSESESASPLDDLRSVPGGEQQVAGTPAASGRAASGAGSWGSPLAARP